MNFYRWENPAQFGSEKIGHRVQLEDFGSSFTLLFRPTLLQFDLILAAGILCPPQLGWNFIQVHPETT